MAAGRLELLRVLNDTPLSDLASSTSTSYFEALCARANVADVADLLNTFLESNLGFWIIDYAKQICADASIGSEVPEEAALLGPDLVFDWSLAVAEKLAVSVTSPTEQPFHELGGQAGCVIQVVKALQAALPADRPDVRQLLTRLQLLQQTAQVRAWLEAHPHTRPPQESSTSWQQRLQRQRARAPGGALFLDHLLDALAAAGAGGAATGTTSSRPQYPPPSLIHAVTQIFMAGSPEAPALHSKLALLLYLLRDLGRSIDCRDFAAAFHLPPATAALWECYYLLDTWDPSDPGDARLAAACQLLQATANPGTPFRVIEALLAAGEHRVALAVQRARGSSSSSDATRAASDGGSSSSHELLLEQQVLLRLRMRCGLLQEALSGLRQYVRQLPRALQASHTAALIKHLTSWALEPPAAASSGSSSSSSSALSRLQQVAQLPLDQQEEAVLLQCLRQRAATGLAGGEMLPLYLLQRGRTPEALKAFAAYRQAVGGGAAAGAGGATPSSAAAAAAAPAGPAADEVMADVAEGADQEQQQQQQQAGKAAAAGGSSTGSSLLQRQLHALMSAAAAELPAALRGAAVLLPVPGKATATAAGGTQGTAAAATAVPLTQGLDLPYPGAAPAGRLTARGVEPPVFLSPLVGGPGLAAAAAARSSSSLAAGAGAGDDDGDDFMDAEGAGITLEPPPTAAGAAGVGMDVGGDGAAAGTGPGMFDAYKTGPSLFGGPGRDAINKGTPVRLFATTPAAGTSRGPGSRADRQQQQQQPPTSSTRMPPPLFGAD